jgi:hypothetical protein
LNRDWFRKTEWNEEIEAAFWRRLGRARPFNQKQYLRIQAVSLVDTHPSVSLVLLEAYFAAGGDILRAFALGTRAKAYVVLKDWDRALEAYSHALAYEAAHPGSSGSAYDEYPLLVAKLRRRERYGEVLQLFEGGRTEYFAAQIFNRCAALALIHDDLGHATEAGDAAATALAAAAAQHSGLRYHPGAGLVCDIEDELRVTLLRIAGGVEALH